MGRKNNHLTNHSNLPFHLAVLSEEFSKRIRKNARYSLRAFSKFLGIDPGQMSKILNRQTVLSVKSASKISEKLNLSPHEIHLFIASVGEEHTKHGVGDKAKNLENTLPLSQEIELDSFNVISDVFHYAILELTFADLKGQKQSPELFAKILGISEQKARDSIERLKNLGLLRQEADKYVKSDTNLTTKNKDVTTPAHKRHQKQTLDVANEAIDCVDIEKRLNMSMTMLIDANRVALARSLVQNFLDSLSQVLEQGQRSEVYQLNVALFPLVLKKLNLEEGA
jgi:uncharacterized protein (TIGR02147 family)